VWYELEVIESFAQVDPFTLVVTPYLPFAGTLLGAAVVGAFAIWNRKRGNVETRAPDVNEIWQKQAHDALELDREYRWRRTPSHLPCLRQASAGWRLYGTDQA
jgi:hypothetical protein